MRRIVRWTIGNTTPHAVSCLRLSIRTWRRLFGNLFDMIVLHNQSKPDVDCLTIDQNAFRCSLPFDPTGPAWKLYPPRIDITAQEVFIDNDLILYAEPPSVKEFLAARDLCFVTQAWRRCYGKNDAYVPQGFTINSGFFGLPPGLDFTRELLRTASQWQGHFDEQGSVASVFCRQKTKIIPLSEIKVCVPEESFGLASCGMHLVGLNNGQTDHWDNLIRSIL